MKDKNVTISGPSLGCSTVFFIALLCIKLTVAPDMSWWIVLLPIYGPTLLFIVLAWIGIILFMILKGKK